MHPTDPNACKFPTGGRALPRFLLKETLAGTFIPQRNANVYILTGLIVPIGLRTEGTHLLREKAAQSRQNALTARIVSSPHVTQSNGALLKVG
jgi:hypothetical protein